VNEQYKIGEGQKNKSGAQTNHPTQTHTLTHAHQRTRGDKEGTCDAKRSAFCENTPFGSHCVKDGI
jgi:hypothetical protein